jgi:hypothetical protein
MNVDLHGAVVRAAGAEYSGTTEGFVWFNAPSGSTLIVAIECLSVEAVRAKLAEDAGKNYS